jgi:hypothetical protein
MPRLVALRPAGTRGIPRRSGWSHRTAYLLVPLGVKVVYRRLEGGAGRCHCDEYQRWKRGA